MSASIRVLLVHQNDEGAARLRARLETDAAPTVELTHLTEIAQACERLTEEFYDVILLDLSIPDEPGLDGFIRLNAQTPETPVIVITSGETREIAPTALEGGAAESLDRDHFGEEPLVEMLVGVIQRYRFQEAIRRRDLLDEGTGVYRWDGFRALAEKHLALAAHGGKELLLSTIDFDASPLSEENLFATAGRIVKQSFRESDIVARREAARFVAMAIVNPGDNALEIVENRIREQLHAHNASRGAEAQLSLRSGMVRVEPTTEWSLEDLLNEIPGTAPAQ
ncbi:MAG TPA: response regulator [Thermoanaerobaculia bacterium]|nr:response regulator [Thermoanaerobaculia bacterium]